MRLAAERHPRSELMEALLLMNEALGILDRKGAPAMIGAPLDLAVAKLEKFLELPERTEIREHSLLQAEDEIQPAAATGGNLVSPWEIPPV